MEQLILDFSSTLNVILRYRAILYAIGRYSPISAIPTLELRRLLLRSPRHPTFPSPFPPTTLLLHPQPLSSPNPLSLPLTGAEPRSLLSGARPRKRRPRSSVGGRCGEGGAGPGRGRFGPRGAEQRGGTRGGPRQPVRPSPGPEGTGTGPGEPPRCWSGRCHRAEGRRALLPSLCGS